MKLIFKIIIMLLAIYMVDLQVCSVYSALKKKKDYASHQQKNVEKHCDMETDMDFLSFVGKPANSHNIDLIYQIKQLLNGWIIYRVKRLGLVPCQKYRTFILKHVFKMDIAPKVVIYGWNTIRAPWNISIGEGSVIGDGVILDGRNFIRIGRNVNMSTGVCIYTEQHDVNDPYFRSLNSGGEVVIGDRVWISSHSTVLPDVRVGEGAVLAAGALTAKDLDVFCVYGGIPARKIGERTKDLRYEFDGAYLPFI